MSTSVLEALDRDGFAAIRNVIPSRDVQRLRNVFELDSHNRAGRRDLFRLYPDVRALATSVQIRAIVEPVLGRSAIAVRALYFEKAPQSNWSIRWHQDRTIAVKSQVAAAQFRGWSTKAGIRHAHAPAAILETLLVLRVHLDAAGADDGGLRVCPGSHAHGILDRKGLEEALERLGTVTIDMAAGDVLLMRPLLIHSSGRSSSSRRRVLHLEFAPGLLPKPLEWHEEVA